MPQYTECISVWDWAAKNVHWKLFETSKNESATLHFTRAKIYAYRRCTLTMVPSTDKTCYQLNWQQQQLALLSHLATKHLCLYIAHGVNKFQLLVLWCISWNWIHRINIAIKVSSSSSSSSRFTSSYLQQENWKKNGLDNNWRISVKQGWLASGHLVAHTTSSCCVGQ